MAYDELNDTTGTIMSPKQKEWLIASANCNYEVCMKLLRANPSLANYQSPIDGNTALHLAAKAGSREIIRMLAGDFKADVNAQNHAGLTPLHYAATNANENTLFLLYSTYKADISIRDLFGRRISAMFPETPEGKRLKSSYEFKENSVLNGFDYASPFDANFETNGSTYASMSDLARAAGHNQSVVMRRNVRPATISDKRRRSVIDTLTRRKHRKSSRPRVLNTNMTGSRSVSNLVSCTDESPELSSSGCVNMQAGIVQCQKLDAQLLKRKTSQVK